MKMPESDIASITDPEVKERSAFGLIIAILIVLLIAILAGLYVWYSTLIEQPISFEEVNTRPTAAENNEPESTNAEAQAESMNVVSTSDELSAIEADLESTDLESLDTEMEAIDAELEAAMSAQ